MNKRKKTAKWLPIVFLLAVFFFMVFFRHDETLSGAAVRSIEQVTYSDEWVEHGNIPEHLKEITSGLDGPVRSKIIHKVIKKEELEVIYIPSSAFYESFAGNNGRPPEWLEYTEQLLAKVYGYDLLNLTIFPPEALEYKLPELEEPEERFDTNFPQMDRPEPLEPSYMDSVREIRSLEPDVILLDMSLLTEHLEEDELSVQDYSGQMLELLETMYNPRDRYYTYMLVNEDLHEGMRFDGENSMLNERIDKLSDQLKYGSKKEVMEFDYGAAYLEEDQLHERWAHNVMVPLFYKGLIP